MKYILHIAVFCVLLSCVTTKNVIKRTSGEVAGTHSAQISGKYLNGNLNPNDTIANEKTTLWWKLKWLNEKLIARDTFRSYSSIAIVELSYFEPYLYASIYENGMFQEETRLKVKIKNDYLKAYKNKVIPFAPLYYFGQEKCLLMTKKDNELVLKFAANEFAMVLLFTGGFNTAGTFSYPTFSD